MSREVPQILINHQRQRKNINNRPANLNLCMNICRTQISTQEEEKQGKLKNRINQREQNLNKKIVTKYYKSKITTTVEISTTTNTKK